MSKKIRDFWFFIHKELPDIIRELEGTLELPEYYHDGEDTWEWYESKNRDMNSEIYFDLYGEHSNGYGRFDSPAILAMNKIQSEIDVIGRLIAVKLGVDVFWGIVNCDRKREKGYTPSYYYDIYRVYNSSDRT